jgi:immune inhibitor A
MRLPNFLSVFLITTLVVITVVPVSAMPPHPDLVERWRREGVLEQKFEMLRRYNIQQGTDLSVWSPEQLRRAATSTTGTAVDSMNLLVLLVEFPDNRFSDGPVNGTPQDFDSILFSDGELGGIVNPSGSLTDYYREVSYGQLHVAGKAYGPYMADHSYSYYVSNDDGLSMSEELVAEAVYKAENDLNFRDYVTENYRLHNLVMIHAGPGAETGAYGIWSHFGDAPDAVWADSVLIMDYIMNPEEEPANGLSPVGVFCHEFGHGLGLPDLYDIAYNPGSRGLGAWCLMASGSWNGESRRPAHPSVWCRMMLGWIDPIDVLPHEPGAVFPPIELEPTSYAISDDWGSLWPQEYWLVENRQPYGFDESLPGHGLCIYHVDLTMPDNTNPMRYRVALEQADGLNELALHNSRGDDGDPFPGATDNREFFLLSNPNSLNNLGEPSQVAVWNISDSDSLMTADLDAVNSRPYLVFDGDGDDSLTFEEMIGDGDGILEGGETIAFNCHVNNVMLRALDAQASLSCDAPGIEFTDNDKGFTQYLTSRFYPELVEPIVFQIPDTFTTRRVQFTLDVVMDTSGDDLTGLDYVQSLTFDTILAQVKADVVEIGDGLQLPDNFAVMPNYPNPFNPSTVIRFGIPRPEQGQPGLRVRLEVYNSLGRMVKTLVNKPLNPGVYEVEWDGTNDRGMAVASGVYLYRLTRGDESGSRKMILLK